MATEVYVPKMTDHMEAAQILQWLAAEGEQVEARQPIVEVMTDKVAAEIEAPAAGVLKGIRQGLDVGTVVPVGETIAFVAEQDEEVPVLPPLSTAVVEVEREEPTAALPEQPAPAETGRVRATPAARNVARQLGVDISRVQGTGPAGRVREEDVRAFAAQAAPAAQPETPPRPTPPPAPAAPPRVAPVATPSPAPSADFDWVDLNPIQRLTGERMAQSARVPQFVLEVSVDVGSLLAVREASAPAVSGQTDEKASVTAFLVKAVASTLKRHPRLNSSFEGGRLKQYRHVNIGVAVGTEQGLMVPVVKGADQKPIGQVASEIRTFGEKARALRLEADEVSGGTFTISNLGMYGVDRFTAMVNPPEAAILAAGQVTTRMVGLTNGTFAMRQMMDLTLSVDHRAVDGTQAAAFLADLKRRIEEPY